METKRKILRYAGYVGLLGILFYFLHIIVGANIYKGYNPVKQAVSDLTAVGAPSRVVSSVLSAFYGVCLIVFFIAFFIYFRKKFNIFFDLGALFLIIMQAISTIGYSAFPLSANGAKPFQDAMHIVVTALVVVSSIAALVFLTIGAFRSKKNLWLAYASIATLVLMMTGSILTGAVPSILGIAERITIFSLHIYLAVLSVWLIIYKEQE